MFVNKLLFYNFAQLTSLISFAKRSAVFELVPAEPLDMARYRIEPLFSVLNQIKLKNKLIQPFRMHERSGSQDAVAYPR